MSITVPLTECEGLDRWLIKEKINQAMYVENTYLGVLTFTSYLDTEAHVKVSISEGSKKFEALTEFGELALNLFLG